MVKNLRAVVGEAQLNGLSLVSVEHLWEVLQVVKDQGMGDNDASVV